jgi:hypothetical protein
MMSNEIKEPMELKPCPFCGAEPRVRGFVADYWGDKCNQFTIECCSLTSIENNEPGEHCGIASSTECGPYFNNAYSRGFDSDHEAFMAALRLWNRRAQ